METLAHWANDVFVWVGFGTVAGLIAKAVLPGKDSGGTVATLLMGIGGTLVGSGIVSLIWGRRVSPLSFFGFLAAVGGATIILTFHRLLSGRFFSEEGTGSRPAKLRKRKQRVTTALSQE